jgi:dipeptidyl aminopeptidase/acylaminoacyl peptidase
MHAMRLRLLAIVSLLNAALAAAAPLPVETMFRRPAFMGLQLSPDGTELAALVPSGDHIKLAVIELDRKQSRTLEGYDGQDIVNYFWLSNGRVMADLGREGDATGTPYYTGHFAADVDGKQEHPTRYATWNVIHTFGDDTVLRVGRLGRSSVVLRSNSRTGEEHNVTLDNPGNVIRWIADFDGNVRVAVNYDAGTRTRGFHYRATGEGPWTELARFSLDDGRDIRPIIFDSDNQHLIVSSNLGGDRRAIYRYDPQARKLEDKLFESPSFDVGTVVVDRKARKLLGVHGGGTASGITWFDPHWKAIQDGIDKALPDMRNSLSWGADNPNRVLVTSWSPMQPPKYWLFDVPAGRLQELPASRGWIDAKSMTLVRQVTYKARDGLEIHGYLAVPKRDDGAKPPLVVLIHGGPWTRGYTWSFDTEAQFLASRGYAVLMPNFRGTTGYGQAFVEKSFRQWGRTMQDDITDGVRWVESQDLVDKDRVCLYGASYGGYAALMGLVREPGMFRCAVAEVAVTDPGLLFEPGWNRAMNIDDYEIDMKRLVGDPDKDRVYFDEVSPLKRAAEIKAPVLLAFGGEDRRVPIVHGTRMRSALEANGTPVEWVMYPDEGHGFVKDVNRFDFYRRVEGFLARNLAK